MKTQRRLLYVMLGGVLALSLVFGAFAVFAQTDGEADVDGAVPGAESEDSDEGETPVSPHFPWQGFRWSDGGKPDFLDRVRPDWFGGSDGEKPEFFGRGMPDRFGGERPELTGGDELLADALGITVEQLQEAREEARLAAIDQAEAEGLLTEEQAEQLRSAPHGFLGRFGRGGAGIFDDTDGHESFLANALGINVIERTREIGMMRAVGARRRQIRRMVVAESFLLALMGIALGVISGIMLSFVMTGVLEFAGMVIPYSFPAAGVVTAIAAGLICAILAALIPARRASDLEIVAALAYE